MKTKSLGTGILAAFLILQQSLSVPAVQAQDALVFQSGGVDVLLVDPKDQGLKNALKLISKRVGDLPMELDEPHMPAPVIQLVLDLLMGPVSLRAGMIEGADPMMGPPFYAQFDFGAGDADQAAALAGRFAAMVANAVPMPSSPAANLPGMQMIDLDGVPLYHGALKDAVKSAFTIGLNRVDAEPATTGANDLPAGIQPVMSGKLDFAKLQPAIDMFLSQAGPEAAMVQQQLELVGLYGADAATITASHGFANDRSHFSLRYTNYTQLLEKMGAAPPTFLTAEDLRMVPADATYAQVTKFDPGSISGVLEMMAEMEGEGVDPFAMIEQEIGINPKRDLLDHLGDTVGIYMSDSTGGGGLLSLAMFMKIKNADALKQTCSKINAMINQAAQQNAKGYVRIVDRTIDGQDMTILTFPGLPIPLEMCWATSGNYSFAALSPQSLLAAIGQSRAGKGSLMDNPRFVEMGGTSLSQAIQVEFVDTPRTLKGGYGLVSLGTAALSNAVRTPANADRDPGVIMPSYSDLAEGAKAYVYVGRLDGNDFLMTSQSDRSFLVNACGMIGVIGGSTGALGAAAIGAGIAMPALAKAKEKAQEAKGMAQLRNLGMAVQTYAATFDDTLPESVDVLIRENYIMAGMLSSPFGPSADGGDDYFINLSVGTTSGIQQPNRLVLAYDRAMYADGHRIGVLFFDGHVESMYEWEFRELIEGEPNAGTDFEIPFEDWDD